MYTIDECGIPFLESQRDLGVIVSGILSWSQQCDTVCSKAYGALYVLRRNVHTTSSISIKKHIYLSLVNSSISYCCQLWRPQLCKNIQSIESIRRRATKYILKDYISDYKSRLLSLHMLPLMYWLDLQDLVFMINALKIVKTQSIYTPVHTICKKQYHAEQQKTKKCATNFQD